MDTRETTTEFENPRYLYELMKALGYKSNEHGICHGLTMMGVQAFLSSDLKTFNERLIFIEQERKKIAAQLDPLLTQLGEAEKANATDTIQQIKDKIAVIQEENLPNQIKKLHEKLKTAGPHYKRSKQEQMLLEIDAFLAGIELYQHAGASYKEWFNYNVPQSRSKSIAKLIASDMMREKGKLLEVEGWARAYDKTTLAAYFDALDYQAKEQNHDLVFVFSSTDHTFSLCYDASKNNWIWFEINKLPAKKLANLKNVVDIFIFGNDEISTAVDNNILLETRMYALGEKHKKSMKYFLENLSNDPNHRPISTFDVTFQSTTGDSVAHMAAEHGNDETMQDLFDEGLDPNIEDQHGQTPLHIAAGNDQLSALKLLLSEGAEIDRTTSNGNTALHIAAIEDYPRIISTLIDAGANINATRPDTMTALFIAAQLNHAQTVKLLLEKGADPNIPFFNDAKSLEEFAKENQITDKMKIFIDNKLNQGHHADKIPITPFEIATLFDNKKTLDMFALIAWQKIIADLEIALANKVNELKKSPQFFSGDVKKNKKHDAAILEKLSEAKSFDELRQCAANLLAKEDAMIPNAFFSPLHKLLRAIKNKKDPESFHSFQRHKKSLSTADFPIKVSPHSSK